MRHNWPKLAYLARNKIFQLFFCLFVCFLFVCFFFFFFFFFFCFLLFFFFSVVSEII